MLFLIFIEKKNNPEKKRRDILKKKHAHYNLYLKNRPSHKSTDPN